MTINELRFVVAVAKEKNFRRAAEKCFVTQPALSHAIKKLEEELGVILFERNRNEISLTTIGEKIVAQANIVLDEALKLKEMARVKDNQLLGALKLGVIYSVGPYLLPHLIPPLRELAPGMPLDVEENLTANLEVQLKNGLIDVAIIALPFDIPGIQVQAIYDEPFVVAVSVSHPWATLTHIDADALATEKVLLLNSGHCFSNQVTHACPNISHRGEVLQGNSLETVKNMVASNLGITVLPASAVDYRNEPLIKIVAFNAPVPTRRIAIATRKSYYRKQALDVLVEAVSAIQSKAIQMIKR